MLLFIAPGHSFMYRVIWMKSHWGKIETCLGYWCRMWNSQFSSPTKSWDSLSPSPGLPSTISTWFLNGSVPPGHNQDGSKSTWISSYDLTIAQHAYSQFVQIGNMHFRSLHWATYTSVLYFPPSCSEILSITTLKFNGLQSPILSIPHPAFNRRKLVQFLKRAYSMQLTPFIQQIGEDHQLLPVFLPLIESRHLITWQTCCSISCPQTKNTYLLQSLTPSNRDEKSNACSGRIPETGDE